MRFSFHLISTILTMLGVATLPEAQRNNVNDFRWILGTWELKTENGILYETWSQTNDSTFAGTSIKVKAGHDTVVLERIQLTCTSQGCYYIPIASGQNDDKPSVFTITSVFLTGFVAGNPLHDFPKKISYTLSNDRLNAVISGDGKQKIYSFARYP